MATDIWEEITPRLALCEVALRDRFRGRLPGVPVVLYGAMEYSLFAGGKRLRPLMCGLACEAVGGRFEQSLAAGAALEMIHTYSLIHDDLPAMDDDDLRRGRPTCHKIYGDALAILAGDALQAMAFDLLIDSYIPAVASVMVKELAKGAGAGGMVGGQVLDLIADGRIAVTDSSEFRQDLSQLELIHCLKTGALFRSCLLLGDFAAHEERNCSDEHHDQMCGWLNEYATAFGLLFQVTDDLLDVEGTEKITGKKTGKDVAKGKLTYPGLLGIAASRAKAAELANACVAVAERFGERGRLLAELARFVERRDR